MKFQETHFEEYVQSNSKENLHPKLDKIFKKMPAHIRNFKNLVFFGPAGVGKYTQMLRSIVKYSPSELKYEKKISVTYLKQQYIFKISDIHYEVDISLLGCNSKLLWHEIYQQIVDIVFAKTEKCGIIVCKNFHEIHSELLENFYSYMQQNNVNRINLHFILITEQLSFIPDNILTCCKIINVPRPTKILYNKILQTKLTPNIQLENISNIKNLNCANELIIPHKITCDKIINDMLNVNELKFINFRDLQYDAFITNLDITECVWYIFSSLLKQNKLKSEDVPKILIKSYNFLQYYNNNYRPIYHLENFLLYVTSLIHNF
jgi:hypothetical protein